MPVIQLLSIFKNILDVILVVNLVLTENYDQIADINSDNEINILDVVAIVNLILN